MSKLLAAAMDAELPDVALEYDSEQCRLLVKLCRELQRTAGHSTFFLSCRTAGRLLNVDHSTANRWLYMLEQDEILQVVSRGSNAGRKATRYRYLAPL
jgi:response regulator of citrate/malate metabolism